jgi:arylsulfatase A-like enzyme
VEAKSNASFAPLTRASLAAVNRQYKLIHYFGYPGVEDAYELYNLVNDPEELNNLAASLPDVTRDLAAKIEGKIAIADRRWKVKADE